MLLFISWYWLMLNGSWCKNLILGFNQSRTSSQMLYKQIWITLPTHLYYTIPKMLDYLLIVSVYEIFCIRYMIHFKKKDYYFFIIFSFRLWMGYQFVWNRARFTPNVVLLELIIMCHRREDANYIFGWYAMFAKKKFFFHLSN